MARLLGISVGQRRTHGSALPCWSLWPQNSEQQDCFFSALCSLQPLPAFSAALPDCFLVGAAGGEPLASLSALSDCIHALAHASCAVQHDTSVISRGYNVAAASASAQTPGHAWQTHTACNVACAPASTHSFRLTGAAAWTRFCGALQVNMSLSLSLPCLRLYLPAVALACAMHTNS